jgi:hypothetical protein
MVVIPVIPVARVAVPEDVALQASFPLVDVEGSPAPELATEVRFAATAKAFVVLFTASAEPPLTIQRGAGEEVFRDECVELFIASSRVPFAYQEIVVNPQGALYAARIVNPDDSRATWEISRGGMPPGICIQIQGDAARPATDWTRWSCRLTVPWTSLPPGIPPAAGEERRGNAYRIARGRSTRYLALCPTLRSNPPDFHVPSRFARLVF